MIRRLPGWVWGGGALLAAVAGMVNAVGLLGAHHQGLSHLTGTASWIGVDAASGQWAGVGRLALIVACFVAGAVGSGVLIGGEVLQHGRRYGVAMVVESLLLGGALCLFSARWPGGAYLLSMACGLQNAMASTFSGAIVRTTHLTGVFTDIGVLLGHAVRGDRLEVRKLSLLLAIAGGFVAGSAAGAWQFERVGYAALWVPMAVTGLVGVVYIVRRQLGRGGSLDR